MGAFGQDIPSIKDKPRQKDPITIMIMRSLGKVRSFKISPPFLYMGVIFILLNITATIYFGNRFFELLHTKALQSEKIRALETEASKNLKTIHRNQQHMAILEEYIRNIESPKKPHASSNKSFFLRRESEPSTPEPEKVPESKPPEAASTQVVDIKDVDIKKEGSELTVNFRVVNLRELDNPIGGYIHMIAVGKDGYSPSAWTFPNEELKDGLPVDFRRGQLFLIQRYKPIDGNFYLPTTSDPPSSIKVLVYNQTGILLLEKEFEVSDDS
jgi:uncharacterized coiled-coil protein SlyX